MEREVDPFASEGRVQHGISIHWLPPLQWIELPDLNHYFALPIPHPGRQIFHRFYNRCDS